MVQFDKRHKVAAAIVLLVVVVSASIGWWWVSSLTPPAPNPGSDDGSSEQEYIILKSGVLVDIDSDHQGSGQVQLVQDSHGTQLIHFIDAIITSGPDLYVYLSKKESFSGATDTPGEHAEIALLPATEGNFSVIVPSTVNGTMYASVLVWCKKYSVPFTYATLS